MLLVHVKSSSICNSWEKKLVTSTLSSNIKDHTNCCNRSTCNNLRALPWVRSPFQLQTACAFLPNWTGFFLLSDTSEILAFIPEMEQNLQLRSRCPCSFGKRQINRSLSCRIWSFLALFTASASVTAQNKTKYLLAQCSATPSTVMLFTKTTL